MVSRRSSCSRRAATSTITTTPAIARLGAVAGGDRARRCTAFTRRSPTSSAGARARRPISTASGAHAAREAAVREAEAALKIARQIPFGVLVLHLGTPTSMTQRGRQSPRRRASAASRRSAGWPTRRGVRVALEVIPNRAVASRRRSSTLLENETRRPRRRHLPRLRPRPPDGRRRRRHRDRRRAPHHDARPRQPRPRG